MNERSITVLVAVSLSLLLFGCAGETTPDILPDIALDQMPLMLASPLFQAGYELVSYHELDANGDGAMEVLAVLTLRIPVTVSYLGDTYAMLFGQRRGAWSITDSHQLDGINASAELRDLTGDGLPELLVFTEEAEEQLGDFVTPFRYTDHLTVFTPTPDLHMVELGTFSSSQSGVTRPQSTVGEWGGQPAIQTVQDIPPTGGPLWWPYRVETFAWDGRGFASRQVREQRRISPIVSWLVRRNMPWAAAFLALSGVLCFILVAVARRLRLRERWGIVGVILLLTAGGVGLGLAQEWLCVPALILAGLAGLGVGRQMATRMVAELDPDTEMESEE